MSSVPFKHQEEVIGVVMLVPVEWPFELGDHDVVIVVGGKRFAARSGRKNVASFSAKIGGRFHGGCFCRSVPSIVNRAAGAS